jgi:hypothetical protein
MSGELLLESHFDQNEGDIVLDRASEMLQQVQGKVLIVLEGVNMPEQTAQHITSLIDYGVLPSIAYLMGQFPPEAVEMYRDIKFTQKDAENIFGKPDQSSNRLRTLDKLEHFKDEEGKPRFKILLEGNYDEDEPDLYRGDDYHDARESILEALDQGNIEDGVEQYKTHVKRWARHISVREKKVVEKISDNMDGIDGLIINFGAAHTRIQHLLDDKDIPVKKIYIEDGIHSSHWYNPEAAAVRKVMMVGEDSLTDLEWKQSLYGEVILLLFQNLRDVEKAPFLEGYTDQDLLVQVRNGLAKINSDKDMENFETDLRTKGYEDSVFDLY